MLLHLQAEVDGMEKNTVYTYARTGEGRQASPFFSIPTTSSWRWR